MKRSILSLTAAVALALTATAQMNGFGQQQPTGYGQQPSGYGQQPSPYGQPVTRGFQPPGQVDYSKLSGIWMLSTQQGNDRTPWQIQVSPNGQFKGVQGKAQMVGQFRGPVGQAKFMSVSQRNGRPLPQGDVQLQFDGGCHVQMVMYGQGRQVGQGVYHVNHQAGEPCPQ